jgi:hypothetical protein
LTTHLQIDIMLLLFSKVLNMLSKEEFSQVIEKFVRDKKCSYMDAIVLYAEDKGIEIESIALMINKNIKQKLEVEAQDLNYLPKTARLPI